MGIVGGFLMITRKPPKRLLGSGGRLSCPDAMRNSACHEGLQRVRCIGRSADMGDHAIHIARSEREAVHSFTIRAPASKAFRPAFDQRPCIGVQTVLQFLLGRGAKKSERDEGTHAAKTHLSTGSSCVAFSTLLDRGGAGARRHASQIPRYSLRFIAAALSNEAHLIDQAPSAIAGSPSCAARCRQRDDSRSWRHERACRPARR